MQELQGASSTPDLLVKVLYFSLLIIRLSPLLAACTEMRLTLMHSAFHRCNVPMKESIGLGSLVVHRKAFSPESRAADGGTLLFGLHFVKGL